MELSIYIEQLLQEHNCVIVPHFGGFIGNYQSATMNWSSRKIAPPSKSVLFNSNLIHNDGLLGHAVSADQQIAYPAALDFIQNKVKNWQLALDKGKRVEIGELGFLFKANNQIIFEQSRELNILLSAYGLTEISFVNFAPATVAEAPLEKLTIAPENKVVKESLIIELNPEQSINAIEVEEKDEQIIPIEARNNKRLLKYIGVAAAIPLMFYTYWIPMETDFIDTGKIQFADFNPIRKAPERSYQLRHNDFESPTIEHVKTWDELTENLSAHVAIYNYQFDDQLYIPIRLDKTATAVNTEIQEQNGLSQGNDEKAKGLNYHLIGGCFSVKENAENLVVDLRKQGYEASIYDFKGGLYRVSAGDYSTGSIAEERLSEFKSKGFSGWILKR